MKRSTTISIEPTFFCEVTPNCVTTGGTRCVRRSRMRHRHLPKYRYIITRLHWVKISEGRIQECSRFFVSTQHIQLICYVLLRHSADSSQRI